MKQKLLFFGIVTLLIIIGCQESSDLKFDDKLVLENFDYFENAIPYSRSIYSLENNHDEIASLGRLLFYDTRLSQNNSIACANCHDHARGFSDADRFSRGLKNFTTSRNSMSLVNNAYQRRHFWTGQSGRIEDHILDPISNHIEMGMRNVEDLVEKLSGISAYENLFNQVYGRKIEEDLIAQSIATFVASIISYNTKFDRGTDIEFSNFTINEKKGLELFEGKAKCASCHTGDHFTPTWRSSANIGLDMDYEDEGAGNGKFKIPSLRNIELTSPYMHDGRFETLEEVVNHYVNGVQDHPELDWELRSKIDLTEEEQGQLIEFLHTLTDYTMISDPKFSSPFR